MSEFISPKYLKNESIEFDKTMHMHMFLLVIVRINGLNALVISGKIFLIQWPRVGASVSH